MYPASYHRDVFAGRCTCLLGLLLPMGTLVISDFACCWVHSLLIASIHSCMLIVAHALDVLDSGFALSLLFLVDVALKQHYTILQNSVR